MTDASHDEPRQLQAGPARVAGDPVSSATATLILEQAAALFAQKGFNGTSIREIAEAAGVTKPTLYYYFGSKEGLIRRIVEGAMGDFARGLKEHVEGARPLYDTLVEIARGQLEYAETHPASVALVCRLNHEPPGEPWTDDLRRLQNDGMRVLRECFDLARQRGEIADRDPQLLALSFLGALLMHTVARMNHRVALPRGDGNEASAAGIAASIVALFLTGARAPSEGDGELS